MATFRRGHLFLSPINTSILNYSDRIQYQYFDYQIYLIIIYIKLL
jgi:hypothetical protein